MKAHSVGVETTIEKLTLEEINKLLIEPLTGQLKFYGVNSDEKREIPFELRFRKKQREPVKTEIIPKRIDFGDASKIIFSINKEYYTNLKDFGAADWARFFSGAGRLNIYSIDYKPY
jgi:hypothetical protein